MRELEPVLEWTTRITFLKEVPAGAGLSYGHSFVASRASLVATIPVGYGDGLRRNLSNQMDLLVGGVRCPQVGWITMDQTLVDVSAVRGRVALGDPVVLLGRQGYQSIGADEWARRLGTISYDRDRARASRAARSRARLGTPLAMRSAAATRPLHQRPSGTGAIRPLRIKSSVAALAAATQPRAPSSSASRVRTTRAKP